jgi:hypothetical protein
MEAIQRRPGNYWHMLPMAEQARKAIWDAVNPHTGRRRIDEAFPIELRRNTIKNEMKIEFWNGAIWQVVGSDNYNALVGSPPIGVVVSEWSLADPSAWAYLRPILRENDGWAIFIYTPRGRNHGLALYESAKTADGWFHQILTANQTDVFTPEQLAEELAELQTEYGLELGRAFFEQEYECSFDAAVIGAVYAAELRKIDQLGQIGAVEHDPRYEVHTAWDLGFSDATAVWFFQILPGPRVHLIDYLVNHGQTIEQYAGELFGRELRMNDQRKLEWGLELPHAAHRKAYTYGKHYWPHDGAHKTLAAGGRSLGDQAYALGVPVTVIPATTELNAQAAARKTIGACWFDQRRCLLGLNALRSYHYPWDEKHRTLKVKPVHDWSSHGSKAFEVLARVWQPQDDRRATERPRFLSEATADEVFWPANSGVTKFRERI